MKGGDGLEATVRKYARKYGNAAKYLGVPLGILGHQSVNFSAEQYAWALDEWKKMGIIVTSYQLAVADIMAKGTDEGDGVYTRTFTPHDYDYTIIGGSSFINAGVPIAGLDQDILGRLVPMGSSPDVGITEFTGGGGLDLGLGLG
jgi:hypothetical protein